MPYVFNTLKLPRGLDRPLIGAESICMTDYSTSNS